MDVDKAISEAHLRAAGWDLNVFRGFSPFECHFIYLNDIDSGTVQLVSISKMDFKQISPPGEISQSELAYAIAESVLNANFGEHYFVPVVVSYVKKSAAYGQWKRQSGDARLHFFINLYNSKHGSKETMVRPFIAMSDAVVIDAQQMLALSKDVHRKDLTNNPKWFRP